VLEDWAERHDAVLGYPPASRAFSSYATAARNRSAVGGSPRPVRSSFAKASRSSSRTSRYRPNEKYLAWRTGTGAIAKLGELVAAQPSIRYFDKTDA
jgi:hypothetical protein